MFVDGVVKDGEEGGGRWHFGEVRNPGHEMDLTGNYGEIGLFVRPLGGFFELWKQEEAEEIGRDNVDAGFIVM